MTEVQVFIGKGGVGKSTCSSLCALNTARNRKSVLLDSMDPAHNLHDIFECALSGRVKKLDPFLFVRETDLDAVSRKYLKGVKRDLAGVYHYQQALNIDKYFQIMKFAPGMEEYAAWLALESCYGETSYDHVFIDTPPTALTMKTLALGRVNLLWIEQLESMRREILKKKNAIKRIRREDTSELAQDTVFARLQKMKARYLNTQQQLQNRDRTRITLILNEDNLSFSESLKIKEELDTLSIPLFRVIINKSTGLVRQHEKIRNALAPAMVEVLTLQGESLTGITALDNCRGCISPAYSGSTIL